MHHKIAYVVGEGIYSTLAYNAVAQQLLTKAVEAEFAELRDQRSDVRVEGKQAVVRNGYLPERTVQTGLGDFPVKVSKVRNRSGSEIKFNSSLVPPYLKRTKAMECLSKD